jgi:hypothetical protein
MPTPLTCKTVFVPLHLVVVVPEKLVADTQVFRVNLPAWAGAREAITSTMAKAMARVRASLIEGLLRFLWFTVGLLPMCGECS